MSDPPLHLCPKSPGKLHATWSHPPMVRSHSRGPAPPGTLPHTQGWPGQMASVHPACTDAGTQRAQATSLRNLSREGIFLLCHHYNAFSILPTSPKTWHPYSWLISRSGFTDTAWTKSTKTRNPLSPGCAFMQGRLWWAAGSVSPQSRGQGTHEASNAGLGQHGWAWGEPDRAGSLTPTFEKCLFPASYS